MAQISEIVSVTVSLEDARTARQGFDTILILGSSANSDFSANEVRSYTDLEGILDDGFTTSDGEYLAALQIFAQETSPLTIKIAKEATKVAQQQTLTVSGNFVTGNDIDLDIDGVAVTTTSFTSDHATTLAALATNIQAHASVASATVTDTYEITITAVEAGVPITISGFSVTGGASQETATIATTVANVGVQEDLAAIIDSDNDWYGLVMTDTDEDDVALAAAYIETKRKLFATRSTDADVYNSGSTTDIAAVLQAADYDRTMVIHAESANEYVDAAILSRALSQVAGSVTFKFLSLSGVTVTTLTSTQRTAVTDKNANLYDSAASQGFFKEGTMASGEFADVIIGADWITARIEENIFTALLNAGRIPYTDQGIGVVEAEIRGVLRQAIDRGILANYTQDEWDNAVTVPLAANVSTANKAARLLEDVEFNGTLAGAIHRVTLAGQLSV